MHINNIINNILINILNCFMLTSIFLCITYIIIYKNLFNKIKHSIYTSIGSIKFYNSIPDYLILFICYLAAITSDISYIPSLLPARNLAASIAPLANTDLEYAVCVNSITSSSPAKITS